MARSEEEAIDAVALSSEEEQRIDEAICNARDPEDEDVALSVCFDQRLRMLRVELKSGQWLSILQEDLEGISTANPEDLCEIEILGPGTLLDFVRVDEGYLVNHLRLGLYGSRFWMDGLEPRRREWLRKVS